MERLRGTYTEVWAPTPVLPLFQFADRVRSISSTGIDLVGIPGVDPPEHTLAALRGFDSIVSWYGSSRPDFRKAVAHIGVPFEFHPALPAGDGRAHVVDFFLRRAGAPCGGAPRIAVEPRPHDSIVIHPFSGSPRKNWPMTKFRALSERLGHDYDVDWCVAPGEQLPGAVKIADLLELASWLAGARAFIGNDCGITHLAAAAGARVVAIFGPTDPNVWGPRGDRVRIVAGALEDLPVDDVVSAVTDLL